MNERIENRGDWWVPGSERRWPGTFTPTPTSGAKLTVGSYRPPSLSRGKGGISASS